MNSRASYAANTSCAKARSALLRGIQEPMLPRIKIQSKQIIINETLNSIL